MIEKKYELSKLAEIISIKTYAIANDKNLDTSEKSNLFYNFIGI